MNEPEGNGGPGRTPIGPRRSLSRATTGVARRVMTATSRMQLGRVARIFLDGGFGFVRTHDGVMAYFAAEDVVDCTLADLAVGDRVRFELGGDGTPHAAAVARA